VRNDFNPESKRATKTPQFQDYEDAVLSANILPFRGKMPHISDAAFIAQTAVIIGDVEIGAGSSIWYGCTVRGDMNEIRIGKNVNIQDGTVVHVDSRTYGTYIHGDVTIGHMALIHACILEEGCMIGMRATVMDGAIVEKGALLAAGALLAPGKRVGAGEVWAGTPARKLRQIGGRDQDMLDYIWPSYRDLSAEYIAAGFDCKENKE
jgi:carbonic anhydrase/acetyltransferase-like protein (isoleucine patch superfamily)